MNDIRHLMDNLQTQMEYKEFDAATRAPTDSWPVLERLGRAAGAVEAPAAAFVPAAPAAAPAAFAPLTPPAPVVQPEAAPARPRGGSLLGRYAAAAAAEPEAPATGLARQLPLAEVFARLERAGR